MQDPVAMSLTPESHSLPPTQPLTMNSGNRGDKNNNSPPHIPAHVQIKNGSDAFNVVDGGVDIFGTGLDPMQVSNSSLRGDLSTTTISPTSAGGKQLVSPQPHRRPSVSCGLDSGIIPSEILELGNSGDLVVDGITPGESNTSSVLSDAARSFKRTGAGGPAGRPPAPRRAPSFGSLRGQNNLLAGNILHNNNISSSNNLGQPDVNNLGSIMK